jgi:anthranilate synthase component 1
VSAALHGGMGNFGSAGSFGEPAVSLRRDAYLAGVKRAQEFIAAGDVYQLVLASRFSGRHQLDPFQVYRALRLINPSPYMYFCKLGGMAVVGSSPEALVKLTGRNAELRPIAGTLPRMPDAAADLAN